MGIKIKIDSDQFDKITDTFASAMSGRSPWTEYSYNEEISRLFWTNFGAILCAREYRELDNAVWLEFEHGRDATYFKLKWC